MLNNTEAINVLIWKRASLMEYNTSLRRLGVEVERVIYEFTINLHD
jgi:hypothetical protein